MSKNKLSESYQIRSSALKQRNIDIFHEHFPHLREEKLEACFNCYYVNSDLSFSIVKKNRGKLFLTDAHLLFYVIGKRNHGFTIEMEWGVIVSVKIDEVQSNVFQHKSIQIKNREQERNFHFIEFDAGLKRTFSFINDFYLDFIHRKADEEKRRKQSSDSLDDDHLSGSNSRPLLISSPSYVSL